MGGFEIFQSAAVLLIGIGGAVRVGSGETLVGASALTAGALSYAAAFAFVRRQLGRGRNFFFYSSLALVLVLAGSRLLGLDTLCTILWAVLAAVSSFLGGRFDRVTLRAHGAVFAVAAALQSGLLAVVADAFVGPLSPLPPGARLSWLVLLLVTLAYAMLVATRGFRMAPRLARLPRIVLALLSSTGILAFGVRLAAEVAPGDTGMVSLAAIRTVLLASAAVALALARRRGIRELGWLAAAALGAGALKLVLEDLPAGGASSLVVAFACYGAALILVPRLLRSANP